MRFRVRFDSEKCVGCRACVKSCACGILELIENTTYPVEPENCRECKDYSEECEVKAISIIHI